MRIVHWLAVTTALGLMACNQGPASPRGFSLPLGDEQAGEMAFKKYQCLSCHTLEGFDDKDVESQLERKVRLGGDVTKIKTYGELVTSVINPSHKIAPAYKRSEYMDEEGHSKMQNYNDVMTVTDMVNIVTFLQPQYNLKPFDRTNYPQYFP